MRNVAGKRKREVCVEKERDGTSHTPHDTAIKEGDSQGCGRKRGSEVRA